MPPLGSFDPASEAAAPTGLPALLRDPRFNQLDAASQRGVAAKVDPRLEDLDAWGQDRLLTRLAPDPYAFTDRRHGFPEGTTRAFEGVESGGQPNPDQAVSPTGVRGRMQITRATGYAYGLPDDQWDDPHAQISTFGNILAGNLEQAKGDFPRAVALYGDHTDPTYAGKVLARIGDPGGGRPGTTFSPPTTTPTEGWSPQTPGIAASALQATKNVAGRLARAPYDLTTDLGLTPNPDRPGRGLLAAAEDAGRLLTPEMAPLQALGETVGIGTGRTPQDAQSMGDKTALAGSAATLLPGAVGAVARGARGLSRAGRAADATSAIRSYLLQFMDPKTGQALPGAEAQLEHFLSTEAPRVAGRFTNWGASGPVEEAGSVASRGLAAANQGMSTLKTLGRTKVGGGTGTALVEHVAGAIAGHFLGGHPIIGWFAGPQIGRVVAPLASKIADASVGNPAFGMLVRGLSRLTPGTPEFGRVASSLLTTLQAQDQSRGSLAPPPSPAAAAR